MELHEKSLTDVIYGLSNREFSAVELTEAYLATIESKDKDINAFITVRREEALAEAAASDKRRAANTQLSHFDGISFGVKDSICTRDIRSTAAAKILDTYIAPYDATVVKKLRDGGAIVIGKQNCDAFGHGASNENSMYGPVKNPHNTACVAGGSSGGSAAAVAAGMCAFSIAEDTGGSIRQPASFCGVVGMRPSYGRNSRYGVMAMASSLDTVGPMTKTVADMTTVMQAIAGHDTYDATSVSDAVPAYSKALDQDVRGLRVGIPKEYLDNDSLDSTVREKFEKVIAQLEQSGAILVPLSMPHTKYAIPTYYILVPSEDSSNMARLDGIRYGVPDEHAKNLLALYENTRAAGFPDEVKRRIMIGTYSLSAGYYDAYYRRAQKVRTRIIADFDAAFTQVDTILTPTSPFTAFEVGAKKNDILQMYLADVYVSPSSLAGIPGLSVPIGIDDKNLPIGMQILAPRLREDMCFTIGSFIEKLT